MGLVIDVPAGVVLQEPLSLAYVLGPLGTVSLPLVYVRLGEGAQATLVEYTVQGSPLPADWAQQATVLPRCIVSASYTDLAAGASLKRFCVHAGLPQARAHAFEKTVLQAQAQLTQVALHGGMDQARCESQVVLQGQGSQARLYSASLLKAQQHLDQRTLQVHEAPGASSDLLYKNVLLDEAKSVFSGLIQVGPQGQKTDAYQKNRNLLLSAQAQSHALPGLEILANDVKCSHGATSSALDPNELFYMVSRGIPQPKAMEMLALGFLQEALAHIDEPACLEYVQRLLHEG
jgi:Fe-S cluster assembly protein SufD